MKRLKLAMIALFTLVTFSNVNAQDSNNPWAVSIGVNALDVRLGNDFSDHLNDNYGTQDWNILQMISRITGEKYLSDGFTIQFAASVNQIQTINRKNDSDLIYYSLDANIKYDLDGLVGKIFGGTSPYFNPFIYAGGGYSSLDSRGEGMFNYGWGFNVWLSETVGIVYQTGSKESFADNVPSHYQHSLGVVFRFGGVDTDGDGIYDKEDACPEVAGLKEFNGCPDSDGDGIKDGDDSCPNVAGLATLNGCPDADGDGIADKDDMCPNDKGTKANNGCPDTDGDGVVDKDDKCATVAGPKANGGCPWPDTDGDGVLDKDDNCKNEAGPASNNGCPEPVISDVAEAKMGEFAKTILFNSGRSSFKAGVSEKLDGIVKIMQEFPKATFTVGGHTDSTGSKKINDGLSQKRAEAVMNYLTSKGVDPSRLSAKGYGSVNPIDSNDTRAGRANNRRVEIKVTNE